MADQPIPESQPAFATWFRGTELDAASEMLHARLAELRAVSEVLSGDGEVARQLRGELVAIKGVIDELRERAVACPRFVLRDTPAGNVVLLDTGLNAVHDVYPAEDRALAEGACDTLNRAVEGDGVPLPAGEVAARARAGSAVDELAGA